MRGETGKFYSKILPSVLQSPSISDHELTDFYRSLLYHPDADPELAKTLFKSQIENKARIGRIRFSELKESGPLPEWAVRTLKDGMSENKIGFSDIAKIRKEAPEIFTPGEYRVLGMQSVIQRTSNTPVRSASKIRGHGLKKLIYEWKGSESEARELFRKYLIDRNLRYANYGPGEMDFLKHEWGPRAQGEAPPAWLSDELENLPKTASSLQLIKAIQQQDPKLISDQSYQKFFDGYAEEWKRALEDVGRNSNVSVQTSNLLRSLKEIPEKYRGPTFARDYYSILSLKRLRSHVPWADEIIRDLAEGKDIPNEAILPLQDYLNAINPNYWEKDEKAIFKKWYQIMREHPERVSFDSNRYYELYGKVMKGAIERGGGLALETPGQIIDLRNFLFKRVGSNYYLKEMTEEIQKEKLRMLQGIEKDRPISATKVAEYRKVFHGNPEHFDPTLIAEYISHKRTFADKEAFFKNPEIKKLLNDEIELLEKMPMDSYAKNKVLETLFQNYQSTKESKEVLKKLDPESIKILTYYDYANDRLAHEPGMIEESYNVFFNKDFGNGNRRLNVLASYHIQNSPAKANLAEKYWAKGTEDVGRLWGFKGYGLFAQQQRSALSKVVQVPITRSYSTYLELFDTYKKVYSDVKILKFLRLIHPDVILQQQLYSTLYSASIGKLRGMPDRFWRTVNQLFRKPEDKLRMVLALRMGGVKADEIPTGLFNQDFSAWLTEESHSGIFSKEKLPNTLKGLLPKEKGNLNEFLKDYAKSHPEIEGPLKPLFTEIHQYPAIEVKPISEGKTCGIWATLTGAFGR